MASGKNCKEVLNHHTQFKYQKIQKEFKNKKLERILDTTNAPLVEKPVFIKTQEDKTVLHWGQRKLLMSEIEFLTEYSKPNDTVLYAGSACGTHLTYLNKLFPTLKYVLVDPAKFNKKLFSLKNFTIRNEYFTEDLAKEYANHKNDLLFISDIRRTPEEEIVREDMEWQQNWVEIMKPRWSMLKFRLPWSYSPADYTKTTNYLDGKVYIQVWSPISSTETRLVIKKGAKRVEWKNYDYERQMFYFNLITRAQYYEHPLNDIIGFDHCYDCTAEYIILDRYLKKYKKSNNSSGTTIKKMINEITKELISGNLLTQWLKYYSSKCKSRDCIWLPKDCDLSGSK